MRNSDYQPRIKLPRNIHTQAKTWAAAHEITLQEAVVTAVKALVGDVPPVPADARQLRLVVDGDLAGGGRLEDHRQRAGAGSSCSASGPHGGLLCLTSIVHRSARLRPINMTPGCRTRTWSTLRARAVAPDLALREGVHGIPADVPKEHDHKGMQSYLSSHGLGRYYSPRLVVPYPPAIDGMPRMRARNHVTSIHIPADEEAGNIVVAEKDIKYPRWLATKDASCIPYIPSCFNRPWVGGQPGVPLCEDTTVEVCVVEAPIKALSLITHGFPAIAMAGVEAGFLEPGTGFRRDRRCPVLNQEMGRISWRGRRVVVVYDSGIHINPAVARGAARLAQVLRDEGAEVRLALLPLFRPVDARLEAREVGLDDDAQDRAMIDDALGRSDHGVESYGGHIKESGDEGPDDFLARWQRYSRLLGRHEAI